ncbi:MAG: hypothetical protein Q4F49_01615 [Pseudoxanthomonas suwonensis]|nr:hypothetical protein [Pseudoxanthomonas suwonensis]
MRRMLLPLAALALAACQPSEPATTAPVASEPATEAAPPALPEPPDATPIDASYACEGNRVDLINQRGTARIAMSDGRVVSLGGMRGSVPATWRDVGLTFTLDERGSTPQIVLAQDNGPELRCEVLDAPVTAAPVDAPLDATHEDAALPRDASDPS